jgi:hypothetical protein
VRRRIAIVALLFLLLMVAAAPGAFAAQGPLPEGVLWSAELVEHPDKYDGTVIEYEGEAIGEAMQRGEMAWLHINDDAYSQLAYDEGAPLSGLNSGHAVWLPAAEADKVAIFGDNKHRGDLVRVTGTFNAACPEHGGDMDIHATALQVIGDGAVVGDPVQPGKPLLAAILAVIALGLYLLSRLWDRIFPDKVSPFA